MRPPILPPHRQTTRLRSAALLVSGLLVDQPLVLDPGRWESVLAWTALLTIAALTAIAARSALGPGTPTPPAC